MKHFLIVVMTAAVFLLGIYYMVYYEGFYFPDSYTGNLELPFQTAGKKLLIRSENSEYECFQMKGVEISASVPGHYATEFYAEEEDYLRWFGQIQKMGANTIKPQRLMDDEFYNALFRYNTEQEQPLYLLQGISVADEINYGTKTGYDNAYQGQLIKNGKAAVDIIHGRKTIGLGELSGTGKYRKDISDWVIGIVVGNEWNPDAVAYTDHHALYKGKRYEGTYISSGEEATPFEGMIASVMDEIVRYESEKYHEQRPIGFISSPDTDFLEYDENYRIQLGKYSSLDAEHLAVSEKMEAGIFAAYHMFDYCDDFSSYLSDTQKKELGNLLEGLDRDSSYGGYLQLLSRYHTMPVLLTQYGFSSARGAVKIGCEPEEEWQQGEKLMKVYRDAKNYGWSGVCILSWQDIWEQKTWNTSFAADMHRRNLWHNVQSDNENYGLLEFVPGKTEKVCTIDGDGKEWKPKEEVYAKNGVTISLKKDLESLYLFIQGKEISPEKTQYIPIDLAGEVGSRICEDPVMTFDREVDFLLRLDGKENTELLVHERYQPSRERFEYEITGKDPFTVFPEKDSGKFVPIQMVLENSTLLENYNTMNPNERREKTALGTWDTGRMHYGSEDKESREYSSLSDFYFGEQCVEIRIPWMLLNVGDPTLMSVHRDYYVNYGVEFERAKTLWIGAAEEGTAELLPVPMKGFGRKTEVHERLKDSYYIVQKEWKGEVTSEISD